ncbi:MAG: YbhB/YbcL family Raf kinase inhibitor-like protein [Candidatus Colwellbacteria bacterium]|nr:YbhB/YbcL family Raf kinase inhibitor-like protein [Candidatus Colwellbacteria bacterium]
MKLESLVFENNSSIPAKYTCDGENINPPLKFSEVPESTASLVLIMDDPDVPKSVKPDGIWDHWLIWDMPPETSEIREGEAPMGTLGKNTGGSFGYQGPCPPDREHRYFFKLYALDKKLGLPRETTTKKDLEAAMGGHILAETQLMGRYDRAR